MCVLINEIVPKLECAGEVWEGNAKPVKQLQNSTYDSCYKSSTSWAYMKA